MTLCLLLSKCVLNNGLYCQGLALLSLCPASFVYVQKGQNFLVRNCHRAGESQGAHDLGVMERMVGRKVPDAHLNNGKKQKTPGPSQRTGSEH